MAVWPFGRLAVIKDIQSNYNVDHDLLFAAKTIGDLQVFCKNDVDHDNSKSTFLIHMNQNRAPLKGFLYKNVQNKGDLPSTSAFFLTFLYKKLHRFGGCFCSSKGFFAVI